MHSSFHVATTGLIQLCNQPTNAINIEKTILITTEQAEQ